ncbi:MAG: CADD family putative folate metabolism protein [Candidatus Acidiferrales bacterium]|jgi:pyrroloquinoline-quinone synthase
MNKTELPMLLESLDKTIEKYHLLKHPFYRAWTQGKLSPESLALYAEQYYKHVKAFPEHLERLASRSDTDLRDLVNANLAEELDAVNSHPALWRQFAHAVGVTDSALDSAKPLPGIAALLDTFDELAEYGSKAQAVAAFYAYESQVPEIATQKIAGLRRFYGVEDPKALAYFAVHQEADVRHRATWRAWLAKQSDADAVGILCGAERALKALWGALDAVYPQPCAARVN